VLGKLESTPPRRELFAAVLDDEHYVLYAQLMVSRSKLLARVLRGTSDANIPFDALCALLRDLGFGERVKGSHYIFTREGVAEILNLQPQGSKAKVYQVRQVRNVILKHRLAGPENE
jgi:hypothetical protein